MSTPLVLWANVVASGNFGTHNASSDKCGTQKYQRGATLSAVDVTRRDQTLAMITTAEARIIELAAPRHGVFLRRDALAAGVSSSALARRIRSGWIVRRHRGVLEIPALRDNRTDHALAALSIEGAALSHRSAANLHRFTLPVPRRIEVVTTFSGASRSPFASVHRSRRLPSADLVVVDGLLATNPARTLCDLAGVLRPERLRHLVETQLVARSPSPDDLVTCFESWSGKGVAGSVAMRAVLESTLDDEPFAESKLELLTIERLAEYRILGARRQFRPPWYDGRRGIVDFAWPEAKVILEVDGRRFHTTSQSKDDDERRDLLAAEYGWIVIRVGWRTLTHRPTEFMQRLASIIAFRSVVAA